MKHKQIVVGLLACWSWVGLIASLPPAEEPKQPDSPKGEEGRRNEELRANTDRYGDPLPAGAVARLGSMRLRHGGDVYALAYSPDGKLLASVGDDCLVRLWDAASGKEVKRLQGHENRVHCVAFSPDGKLLASGSGDGRQTDKSLWVWDVRTGKELLRHKFREEVSSVAFSHDGRVVAAGCQRGEISLWEVATGKLLHEIGGRTRVNHVCVAFSPDGRTVALASDGAIRLWDLTTKKDVRELSGHKEEVWSVTFDATGKSLASTGRDGTFRVWDVGTGEERVRFTVKANGIQHVCFSPDGKWLAGTGRDAVYLWEVSTGEELRQVEDVHLGMGLAFSPDGETLAWGSEGTIYLADPLTSKPRFRHDGHTGRVWDVKFSPDGRKVLTVGLDKTVRVWESVTGRELYRLDTQACGAFSPDGKALVSVPLDGNTFRRWEAGSGKELPPFPGAARDVAPGGWITFSADGGHFFAHRPGEKQTRLWETSTGKEVGPCPAGAVVGRREVSPDGKYVAFASGPGTESWVRLWDVAAGREMHRLAPADFGSSTLAFSPDGVTLATGEQTIQLWDVRTGKEIRKVQIPLGYVSSLAFSPDGKSLVAGGGFEATAYLYEVATGERRARFAGNVGRLDAVAFSRDGKLLATAGWDGTPLVWDVTGTVSPRGRDAKPTDKELAACWAALGGDDAAGAWAAMRTLLTVPEQAVPLLRERLLVQAADEQKLTRLIADLDHDEFEVRERASRELAALGKAAEPALRKAQARPPSAEVGRRVNDLLAKLEKAGRPAEELRGLRSIEVLEHLGTPKAREVLAALAKGAPELRLTQEAKASLQRLEKRREALP